MRTMVTFESRGFNVSEPRDYFINRCCYGDDVAKWLIARLRARGIAADSEPGQEDFGWYLLFDVPEGRHCCVVGYRPADGADPGVWLAIIERHRGFIGSVLGRRNRGIAASATAAIHAALTAAAAEADAGAGANEIRNVRWHLKDDFDHGREELGSPEP
jgi:hypothetical protein